ncbi:MAG: hypothetical protein AMS22_15725 [Thiotrichales bacterium SG8_50]|nr:MAG: hypothetical protein AMS22_15725 [Thiotrichales bacterium SG8_50]
MVSKIRHADLGDEKYLTDLNAIVHELHQTQRPDFFKSTNPVEVIDWFRSLLQKPTVRIWIAEENGSPIGYILAHFHEQSENPFCLARRWCEIDQIAVHPDFQNTGIGRTLIKKVITEAREEEIRDIELSVWYFNEQARLAFAHLGFIPKVIRYELEP